MSSELTEVGRWVQRTRELLGKSRKEINPLAAAAQVAAKGGDIEQASQLLDATEAEIGTPAAQTGASAQSEQAKVEEGRIRDGLAALQRRILPTQAAGGPAATELRGLLRLLDAQLGGGELDRARLLLERVEQLLSDAEQEHELFRRRLSALASGLETAERDAVGQLAALETALQASADEELRLIGKAGLTWILGDHGARVTSMVKDVIQGEPSARSGAADRALQGVGAYLDHLESSPEIAACDGNDLGIEVSIRATLTFALEAIGKTLAGV